MYVCMYVCMYAPSFKKSLKFFGTSIAPSDTETVDLPAFSILFAMFRGACGPTEKLSLALEPRSNVLRMIVKLAYWDTIWCRHSRAPKPRTCSLVWRESQERVKTEKVQESWIQTQIKQTTTTTTKQGEQRNVSY